MCVLAECNTTAEFFHFSIILTFSEKYKTNEKLYILKTLATYNTSWKYSPLDAIPVNLYVTFRIRPGGQKGPQDPLLDPVASLRSSWG